MNADTIENEKRMNADIIENSKLNGQQDTTQAAICRRLGREAFEQGIKRAPCLDLRLMALIHGGADSCLVCTNWLKGWDRANIDAPAPVLVQPLICFTFRSAIGNFLGKVEAATPGEAAATMDRTILFQTGNYSALLDNKDTMSW